MAPSVVYDPKSRFMKRTRSCSSIRKSQSGVFSVTARNTASDSRARSPARLGAAPLPDGAGRAGAPLASPGRSVVTKKSYHFFVMVEPPSRWRGILALARGGYSPGA